MKILFLLPLIVNFNIAGVYSQIPKLDYKKRTKLREIAYLKDFGITKINPRKFQLELRIWKDNYATGQTKMLRLVQEKNNDWTAQSLDYYCYNNNSCNKEEGIFQLIELNSNWPIFWNKIIDSNLLDVPDQSILNNKLNKESEKLLAIADGGGWTIEVITKRGNWKTVYHNPRSYAEFYGKSGGFSKEYVKPMKLFLFLEECFNWRYIIE